MLRSQKNFTLGFRESVNTTPEHRGKGRWNPKMSWRKLFRFFSSAPSEVRILTLIDETGELEKVDMKMREKNVKRARSWKKEKVIANYQINEQQSFKPDIKLSNDLSDDGPRIPKKKLNGKLAPDEKEEVRKSRWKLKKLQFVVENFFSLSFVFFIWLMTPNIATSWKSFSHVSRIFHMNGMEKRPDSAEWRWGRASRMIKGNSLLPFSRPLLPKVCVCELKRWWWWEFQKIFVWKERKVPVPWFASPSAANLSSFDRVECNLSNLNYTSKSSICISNLTREERVGWEEAQENTKVCMKY